MTLGLTQNTGSNVIPCLPCCNFVYTECGCPTNNRLNEIGQKPEIEKSVSQKLVTFFIDDLFANESLLHTQIHRNDALMKDGAAAYSVTCSGGENNGDFIWNFGFTRQYTPLPSGRTLSAQVRFNYSSKTFDAKIILDGVDPGWSPAVKTFSNDYMTTLKGESGGLTFISHSICTCNAGSSPSTVYCPFVTNEQTGKKTIYVSFNGLPSCLKSDYEINLEYIDPQLSGPYYPLDNIELMRWRVNFPTAGACSGRRDSNWAYNSVIAFRAKSFLPYCLSSQLFFSFSWDPEVYTGFSVFNSVENLSNRQALTYTSINENSGFQVGTTAPWETGLNTLSVLGSPAYGINSWISTAYDLIIDFEPIFISGKIMGLNYIDDDWAVPHYLAPGGWANGILGYLDLIEMTLTE